MHFFHLIINRFNLGSFVPDPIVNIGSEENSHLSIRIVSRENRDAHCTVCIELDLDRARWLSMTPFIIE